MCVEAGLVWGDDIYFEPTKVEANAAVKSLTPRWAVEAHLGELFNGEEQEEEDSATTQTIPVLDTLAMVEDATLQERNATKSDSAFRSGWPGSSFKSGYRPRTSDSPTSKTNADTIPIHLHTSDHFCFRASGTG